MKRRSTLKKILISLSFILCLVAFKEVGEVSAETEYVPQNKPPTIQVALYIGSFTCHSQRCYSIAY